MAEESARFVHDERPDQISVDITSWGIIRALNLPDADVDDKEDYDEGFEDEDYDWLQSLIIILTFKWSGLHLAFGMEYIKERTVNGKYSIIVRRLWSHPLSSTSKNLYIKGKLCISITFAFFSLSLVLTSQRRL